MRGTRPFLYPVKPGPDDCHRSKGRTGCQAGLIFPAHAALRIAGRTLLQVLSQNAMRECWVFSPAPSDIDSCAEYWKTCVVLPSYVAILSAGARIVRLLTIRHITGPPEIEAGNNIFPSRRSRPSNSGNAMEDFPRKPSAGLPDGTDRRKSQLAVIRLQSAPIVRRQLFAFRLLQNPRMCC